MPEKDTGLWAGLLTVLGHIGPWVATLFLSIAATGAQYAQKLRNGEKFSWRGLLLDGAICIFVGIVTHLICVASGVDPLWTSVLVAINSHMGTRAAMQWERIRDRVLGLDKIGEGK